MSKRWAASALTGGASGALDAIDGSLLTVGDTADVVVAGGSAYHYELTASVAAESSPELIAPDTNGTGKRWARVSVYGAGGPGADENYVTDAEKTVIGNTSNTNTGDQDLSGLVSKVTGSSLVANAEIAKIHADPATASQAQAEDSAGTTVYNWTAQRIWQAVAKWAITATSVFKGVMGGGYKETRYAVTTAGNVTIDLANGNVQRFILDTARQFTMPADPGDYAQSFVLIIECATFTPTWNASPTIEWLTSDGTAPTLVTTANLVNVLTFIWDDTDSRWLGFLAGKETA